jgi:DNA helicase-2/ATP-dependent DNA helicase PcrA
MIVPTEEQRRIIEAPLAPLRVEAGAGTGKTATVAMRIAALVADHGIEPEQVLCLTFTNKAAEELTDRVRSMLADVVGPGREVEVHTYHGFANDLLREFGVLVGVDRNTPVITPTFARQLLRTALLAQPLDHLDVTNPFLTEKLLRLGSTISDNLLAPEAVKPPASIPPGDPWLDRLDMLTVLATYHREKARLGFVDYGDLVRLAYRLITEHAAVAGMVAARYRALLLDEYQDTNPAQRELLRAIFKDGFPLMAVGDPDQTIYEWRGASLRNFADFPLHFPDHSGTPAATLPLALNRRSGSTIIAVANAIRSRVEPFRPLLQALPDAAPGLVAVSWAATAVDEAAFIANRVEAAHAGGRPYGDVAVLFRKNKDIRLVHDALAQRDIPVEVANLGGLLSVPEVADLHAWLRILEYPEDGPALLRILTGWRFRLGLGDLRPLATWAARGGSDDMEGNWPALTLLEGIDHLDELADLDPRARKALERFVSEYRTLLSEAQGVHLGELVRRILESTRAWAEIDAMSDSAALSARLNVYRFLDLVDDWSPIEGRPSLPAFLSHLAIMSEEATEELDTARLSGADAVVLLTVHRAKGLEWPLVFVPAVSNDNFPARPLAAEDPYRFAQFLPFELRLDADQGIDANTPESTRKAYLDNRHLSQEWRIAYVAATRAKEELYWSGAYWYGSPEPRETAAKPSALFELVANQPGVIDLGRADAGPAPEVLRLEPGDAAPDPVFPEGWEEGFRRALAEGAYPADRAGQLAAAESFAKEVDSFRQLVLELPAETLQPAAPGPLRTSVSGLVTYATCPKQFFWSEVDRLPRMPSPAARRGSEIHRRIELHNLGRVPFEDLADVEYDVMEEVDNAGGVDPFAAFLGSEYGQRPPLLVEAPFDLRLSGGAHIAGRIDAVYQHGAGDVEVVDFKTGSPSARPSSRVQLQAYGLAVNEGGLLHEPPAKLAVSFLYLGGALVRVSEPVDDGWLAAARSDLELLAARIEAAEWPPTPGDQCRRCDFLRFCPEGRSHLAENGPAQRIPVS